jgi:hypothetical protein
MQVGDFRSEDGCLTLNKLEGWTDSPRVLSLLSQAFERAIELPSDSAKRSETLDGLGRLCDS